ncbi:hypothetical protein BDV23DRAFT_148503 [Aspergillus alliaceus]|uniref:Uncharacterized protein n=1 Tax=Petromyces alliaceus TaxID=209559 RepID=A0A5N7CJH8_PETAA|nr:hypothetical protein BDV23DRAFT_148503 [Aspergillus alliaceus]
MMQICPYIRTVQILVWFWDMLCLIFVHYTNDPLNLGYYSQSSIAPGPFDTRLDSTINFPTERCR